MRLFGGKDNRKWLVDAIKQFALEKDETYDASPSGVLPENARSIASIIEPQIEYLFSQFQTKDKKWIIEDSEENRKSTGPIMSRNSDNYYYYVASRVIVLTHEQEVGNGIKHLAVNDWERFKEIFFAYNPNNDTTLKIDRWLGIQPDQNVYLVIDPKTNIKWVMKWESVDPRQKENQESAEYNKLQYLGAQCPKRLNGYYFLNFPVLIIEFLQPLDSTDDVIELARQLLVTQLKYIHTYACYFDLKPDNIRKRSSNPPKYFIIDMNLSREVVPGGGYKRLHWTPLFSSQTFRRVPFPRVQFSTYKNDFIELLYVIHQLIAQRCYESKISVFENNRYKVSEFQMLENDFFADPERMNKNPIIQTARGWKAAKSLLEYPLSDEVITLEYMEYLNHLPNFPPPNVHEILSSTLENERHSYQRFLERTQPKLSLKCQICSSISKYKCGDCYHNSAFLCSSDCAAQHVCK